MKENVTAKMFHIANGKIDKIKQNTFSKKLSCNIII